VIGIEIEKKIVKKTVIGRKTEIKTVIERKIERKTGIGIGIGRKTVIEIGIEIFAIIREKDRHQDDLILFLLLFLF
jgi:hypothetical protein